MNIKEILKKSRILLKAYKNGDLGQTEMPEDVHPDFKTQNERLIYFTLPMALNYQRNSYTLWESALKTWNDKDTRKVFDLKWVNNATEEELRKRLLKYKLALQPNKHINTWKRVSETIYKNWNSIGNLFKNANNDFLELKEIIQVKNKKGFPYLSGPKIFNYWAFIISTYGKLELVKKQRIDVAPDTHVIKCSIKLGVITELESEKLSKEEISKKWREVLDGSEISPMDMHSPMWFWSRNGFVIDIK